MDHNFDNYPCMSPLYSEASKHPKPTALKAQSHGTLNPKGSELNETQPRRPKARKHNYTLKPVSREPEKPSNPPKREPHPKVLNLKNPRLSDTLTTTLNS